jgi:hypothetical protein
MYSAEQHRQDVSDWAWERECEDRLRQLVRDNLGGAELLNYKPHGSSYTEWVEFVVRWRRDDGEYGTHIASLSLHCAPEVHGDHLYWGHYFPLHGADPVLVGALARADYEKRV